MFVEKNIMTAVGVVKNAIGSKGFGFAAANGIVDSFTRVEVLIEAGFDLDDFKAALEVCFEYEVLKDGRNKTVRVLEIGGKLSPNFFVEKIVDRANGYVIKKVAEVGHPQYPLGYRLYGKHGQYEMTLSTLAAARTQIGKVIAPPTSIAHGQKTNVPCMNKGLTGQQGSSSKKADKGRKSA